MQTINLDHESLTIEEIALKRKRDIETEREESKRLKIERKRLIKERKERDRIVREQKRREDERLRNVKAQIKEQNAQYRKSITKKARQNELTVFVDDALFTDSSLSSIFQVLKKELENGEARIKGFSTSEDLQRTVSSAVCFQRKTVIREQNPRALTDSLALPYIQREVTSWEEHCVIIMAKEDFLKELDSNLLEKHVAEIREIHLNPQPLTFLIVGSLGFDWKNSNTSAQRELSRKYLKLQEIALQFAMSWADVRDVHEAALFLAKYSICLSERPYVTDFDQVGFALDSVPKPPSSSSFMDVYSAMLQQIEGLASTQSAAITATYPTFMALMSEVEQHGTVNLENIMSNSSSQFTRPQRLGPVKAARLSGFLRTDEPALPLRSAADTARNTAPRTATTARNTAGTATTACCGRRPGPQSFRTPF